MEFMLNFPTKTVMALYITLLLSGAMNLEAEQAVDFDFFYLVLQWPGSFCTKYPRNCWCYKKAVKPVSNFTIHGLWPSKSDGSSDSFCGQNKFRKDTFDIKKINDIEKMKVEWPSLGCNTMNREELWRHEWEKHGTCSEPVLDQTAYFAAALRLKDSVDLLGALNNGEIYPDGNKYAFNLIHRSLKAYPGYVGIGCNYGLRLRARQLHQIFLCVDKDASKLIPCPVLRLCGWCHSQLLFPPFPPLQP